jgi:hypothetical protein
MQQNRAILNRSGQRLLISLQFTSILSTGHLHLRGLAFKEKTVAKYLQCSECGKLAFYYDDFVGTEKPFYKRFMRYPEGETKHEPPRCFNCGGVPRMIHENIKEEKAAVKH